MSFPSHARTRDRALSLLSLVAALLVGFVSFAPSASAHHPEVSAEVTCHTPTGYIVDFTSPSWQQSGGDNGGGANPKISVLYRLRTDGGSAGSWVELPWQPGYQYTQANGYEFADSFTIADLSGGNEVQVRVRADANWGNGAGGGQTTDTAWLTFPTDCDEEGTPRVSTSVVCASGNGTATITLAVDGGDLPTTFVVTNPVTGEQTTHDVAAGSQTDVTLTGLPDGTHTIVVTADGLHLDQQVDVTCDRPGTPDVTGALVCSAGDGSITITLGATGGELPVVFVVTDPRNGTTTERTVAVGATATVTLTGFGDGSVTIPVTADGEPLDVTLLVACDRPGTPSVAAELGCTAGDGTVTLTLSVTAGDLPVTFVVTDPRNGTTTERTVAVRGSSTVSLTGFADGPVTIPVTAGGSPANQQLDVACDEPGVPQVGAGVQCASGDGTVVVTVANTGGTEPIVFVVTDPRDGASQTRTVAVGASASVSIASVVDGPFTPGITADGTPLTRTVTVACDEPGVPEVRTRVVCANFDGDVRVVLRNTGGTEPIVFVVTDPRDGSTQTRTVDVGGSATVSLLAVVDGPFTPGVTADGTPVATSATVDCDRPGTPALFVGTECTDTGGEVTLTMSNTSPAGSAEPIVFEVADPAAVGGIRTVTVDAGSTASVVFASLPDGAVSIAVSADGVALDPATATVDCRKPALESVSTSCEEGGEIVKIRNDGETPVEVTVRKDGTEVKTSTVPPAGTVEVLVPFDQGTSATLSVTAGDEVLLDAVVAHDCVPETTTTPPTTQPPVTTQPPGSTEPPQVAPTTAVRNGDPTTTVAPPEVLGKEVVRPAQQTLPRTGANAAGMVATGLLLLLAGALFLRSSRVVSSNTSR